MRCPDSARIVTLMNTTKRITALQKELTKRRAAGGTYADADVLDLVACINALCATEEG